MEKLPFADQSFDIIVSAGSLSYGDNDIVMNEIYRVLKLQGVFIAIDSLNNNP
jgi:ubiquinone/menaquinone biosynthesis C-methylase UbiE